MARFRRGRPAIVVALLGLLALGAAPVAADTGPPGGGPFAITVDPTGTVSRSGTVTISGTITCDSATSNVTLFDLEAFLTQPVGRRSSVQGNGSDPTLPTCVPGSPTAWSMTIVAQSGKFVGGWATAVVSGGGCDQAFNCGGAQTIASVKLGH